MPADTDATPDQPTGDAGAEAGLVLLALIWGVNFSVIKIALVEISPLAFNALRFPLASLVLLALLRLSGPFPRPAREDWPALLALGLLGHVVYQQFFILGMDATTAGNASLLLATTPVWTLLLSVSARHERPPLRVWIGVFGTAVGIATIVLGGPSSRLEWGYLTGDLLMLASALAWSVYTVRSRSFVHRYGPLAVTAWTLWVGTIGIVLVGIPDLAATELSQVSFGSWLAVVYAGTCAISIAYALWYRGVHRIGNTRTAVYSNLVPVIALLVAWVWLGERLSPGQILGAAIVLVSLSLTRSTKSSTQAPGGGDA